MNTIYYKSDFDFSLTITDGLRKIPLSVLKRYNWGMSFRSTGGGGSVDVTYSVASQKLVNAWFEGDNLKVRCQNHNLNMGSLYGVFVLYIPNDNYEGGFKKEVSRMSLNIDIVGTDTADKSFDVTAIPSTVFIGAFEEVCSRGYKGTIDDFYDAFITMVSSVDNITTTLSSTSNRCENFEEELGDCAKINLENTFNELQTFASGANFEDQINVNGLCNVNGNLQVSGNITQKGESYITHAEEVRTSNNHIILRDGAKTGLGNGETVGLIVQKYDGETDGMLVYNELGEARVGDEGDTQPLLTRTEASELHDGDLLRWDAQRMCAVPLQIQPVDLEVKFEGDEENPVTYWLMSLPGYVSPANNSNTEPNDSTEEDTGHEED